MLIWVVVIILIMGGVGYLAIRDAIEETRIGDRPPASAKKRRRGPSAPDLGIDALLLEARITAEQRAAFAIGAATDRQYPRCSGPVITHMDGGIECLGCDDPFVSYHGEEFVTDRCAQKHAHRYKFACERCLLEWER